ncbi:ATP-binding protein [Amycolatopsis lurida]
MSTPPPVSPRERDVLLAVADRLTNAEIAERLFVSVRTVESHVSALLRKLGARDRRELAGLAAGYAGDSGIAVPGLVQPATSFVGRGVELDTAAHLVAEAQVTTVLGPGGAGKTRLATAVTARAASGFPGGAAFVKLVPARPGYVLETIAAGLGVEPAPQQLLLDVVADRLRGRVLLVLDNCEHVIDDVADVLADLVAANPRLSVLATSRERLGVPGETVLQLGPLRDEGEAVALFTDRARAVDPAFETDPAELAELCRELGGSPLQIELAAARVASLGVRGLLAGLADDPLRMLSTGRGDRRHRSLRAVIEWSYRLLTDEERLLLARLSRFADRFDLDSAAALCPGLSVGAVADLLGRLVDKSLVEPGWSLLDGVRRYAREQLDGSPEAADVTALYLSWAARRAHDLTGRLDGDWQDEFDRIAGDLRAAATTEPRHDLVSDLARLTYARGFLAEASEHWRAAARLAGTTAEAATALDHAGTAAHVLTAGARDHYDLLREAARLTGDNAAAAGSLAGAVVVATRFRGAGFVTRPVSRTELSELLAEAERLASGSAPAETRVAIARAWLSGPAPQGVTMPAAEAAVSAATAFGDPLLLSAALDAQCTAAAGARDPGHAYRITLRRLELVDAFDRTLPQAALEVVDTFRAAVAYAVASGELADAVRIGRRAETDPTLSRHTYWGSGSVLTPLALAGHFAEALARAEPMWESALSSRQENNSTLGVPLLGAALAAGLTGDTEAMATWRQRATRAAGVPALSGSPNLAPLDAFVRARVALHTGSADLPALLADAGGDFTPGRFDGYAAGVAAEIAVVLGHPEADAYLRRAERHATGNRWVAAILTRTRALRDDDDDLLKESAAAFTELGAEFEAARCTSGVMAGKS